MRNYSICRDGDKLALYIDNQFYTYGENCKELEAKAMKVKSEDNTRLYEDCNEEVNVKFKDGECKEFGYCVGSRCRYCKECDGI